MAIYRFRISFEEFDDVHRDIEILSTQTFEQFHLAIQEAIGFDASKPASFFMSNDNWKKEQEITTEINGKSTPDALLMKESRMCDFIADPHQKIYYVFDVPSQWTFYIELNKILPETGSPSKYPVCVKRHGDAPKQYVVVEAPKGIVDSEFLDEEMFTEALVEEEEDVADESEDSTSDDDTGFSDAMDEEEFDNIEESSEEEGEKE